MVEALNRIPEIHVDIPDMPAINLECHFPVEQSVKKRLVKAPLLEREQEANLARRIEVGVLAYDEYERRDDWADQQKEADQQRLTDLQTLIEDGKRAQQYFLFCNLRLVHQRASMATTRKSEPLVDMMNNGVLGLIRAMQKFDYQKGNKFSTFAMFWILQSIANEHHHTGTLIRKPAHIWVRYERLKREEKKLRETNSRAPTLRELARAAELTLEEMGEVNDYMADPESLEAPVGRGGYLGRMIVDGDTDLLGDVALNSARELYRENLDRVLSSREAFVVRHLVGWEATPKAYEEIGELVGCSTVAAAQMGRRALAKLAHPSSDMQIDDLARLANFGYAVSKN